MSAAVPPEPPPSPPEPPPPPPSREAGPAGDAEATPPGEPARRVVARIVDTLIVGIPVSTAGQALAPQEAPATGAVSGAVLIAFAVLSFGYELPQLAIWGRTLGKRFAGLRVVDADGAGRVPLRRLLVRTGVFTVPLALRPVPMLGLIAGAFWLVNGVWIVRDGQGRALHDRAAGTVVVRAR